MRWLVTAANRGIGLEFVRQLIARGEDVVATARVPAEAKGLARLGSRVLELDVAHPVSVSTLARELEGEPLDVLVNNAGIGVGGRAFGSLDYDWMEQCFQVNTLGALRMTEALLPNLRAGERKLVVNVTSKMGSIDDNGSGGAYAYRASKAALNAVTKSMALDLEPEGFTCVVVHPGWVRTRMGGDGAPVTVEACVGGLLSELDELDASRNGSFFDFTGAVVPW